MTDVIYNFHGSKERITITVRGPQGSGKTTLIQAIKQLLEDEDNHSTVLFNKINENRRVRFVEKGFSK